MKPSWTASEEGGLEMSRPTVGAEGREGVGAR